MDLRGGHNHGDIPNWFVNVFVIIKSVICHLTVVMLFFLELKRTALGETGQTCRTLRHHGSDKLQAFVKPLNNAAILGSYQV